MLASALQYQEVNPPGRPRAVVVVLHGFGASGADFVPLVPQLGLPPELGVRFVFPQAPQMPVSAMGGLAARSWFDFQLAAGVDLASLAARFVSSAPDSVQALAGALPEGSFHFAGLDKATLRIRDLLQTEIDDGVPPERIVLAGFSQGGALALDAGLTYSRPLAGVLALSTFLADPSKLGGPRARANAQTPILMCHGRNDAVLPLAMGRLGHDRLAAAGYPIEWQEYPTGHEVSPAQTAAIGHWLRQRLAG